VSAAAAVVGSVKKSWATAGAMVKQSMPCWARVTMSLTERMLASSTLVALPVAVRTCCIVTTSAMPSRPSSLSRPRYGAM
jgi:hypothetical protein